MLWRNSPCLIIGKNQDPHAEINLALARSLGIPVIRRQSGGGAVYHDPGNINFSLIKNLRPGEKIDFSGFLRPVIAALASLGLDVRLSGRNDLTLAGKKISGCALLRAKNKILCHGTLLHDADLDRLASLLTPDQAKLTRHVVRSCRARVANLPAFVTLPRLKAALLACASAMSELPPGFVAKARKLEFDRYRSHAWNMGQSPPRGRVKARRFPWGSVIWQFSLAGRHIASCRISGDFFGDPSPLASLMAGKDPARLNIAAIPWQKYFPDCDPREMRDFFGLAP